MVKTPEQIAEQIVADNGANWLAQNPEAALILAATEARKVDPTEQTPEDIADVLMDDNRAEYNRESVRHLLVRAARAGIQTAWESWQPDDCAPVPEVPEVLAGVIHANPERDVFRAANGDTLVDVSGLDSDKGAEVILVRADGTTATIRGDWETGWTA